MTVKAPEAITGRRAVDRECILNLKKPSAFRFWPAAASLLLVAALCAIIAYWTLQLTAPAPAVAPADTLRADGRNAVDPRALGALFGVPAAMTSAPVAATGNIQVVGITAGDSRASAILAVDGGPARFFSVGATVAEGVKLVAVKRDAVVIERGGARSELPAPLKADLSVLTSGVGKTRQSGAAGASAPPHGAAAAAAATPSLPPGANPSAGGSVPAPVNSSGVQPGMPPPGAPAPAYGGAPPMGQGPATTPGNVFIPNATIGGSPSNMPAPNTAVPGPKSL